MTAAAPVGRLRWVVKVGGSLEQAAALPELLSLLVEHAAAGIVIVPGGGRFARRVRLEQATHGLDDETAHRRAILAMEQYAGELCKLNNGLAVTADVATAGRLAGQGRAPVWLPGQLLAGRADIPTSWQVTSDSLALWFAAEINAKALVLVKSVPPGAASLMELSTSGYLDSYFPRMRARAGSVAVTCLEIERRDALRQWFRSGRLPAGMKLLEGSA